MGWRETLRVCAGRLCPCYFLPWMVGEEEEQPWGPATAELVISCGPQGHIPWLGWATKGGVAGLCVPHAVFSPPHQINLLIFMRILKVILAKLRANQKGYADYKLR